MRTTNGLQALAFAVVMALTANPSFGATNSMPTKPAGVQAKTLAANTESLLEGIRANGKKQAAEAAYQLSLMAAGRRDMENAYLLVREAVDLAPESSAYAQAAVHIAFALKRFADAATHQRNHLELVRAETGDSDPLIATFLDNLGVIQLRLHRYEAARQAFEQGLAIRREGLGDAHPQLVISHQYLALVATEQDLDADAESHLTKALSIRKRAFGDAAPEAASGIFQLAEFYRLRDRWDEAEPLYLAAIRIAEQDAKTHAIGLAMSLNGLGNVYFAQERLEDAQIRFEQMRDHLVDVFGAQHPYVTKTQRALAELRRAKEKRDRTSDLYGALVDEFARQVSDAPRPPTPTTAGHP